MNQEMAPPSMVNERRSEALNKRTTGGGDPVRSQEELIMRPQTPYVGGSEMMTGFHANQEKKRRGRPRKDNIPKNTSETPTWTS